MEFLFDLFGELHSILRTRLPHKWDFVDLKHSKDLSAILNNIIYFSVYIAFLVWFVKVFISRIEYTSGRRLEAADKYLVAVVSIVSAMHVIWPFLLFLTHILTCSYYPWATTAVVLLLDISLIASSRKSCSDISSENLNFLDSIIRILSFEWLTTFRVFCFARKLSSANGIFDRGNSEEDIIRPSATPVIQPRLPIEEEYRPSEAPIIQPRIEPVEHIGPSQAPVIHLQKAAEETYRPSETPRVQPQLTSEKPHGPSETPVIQPRLDVTALHKASKAPNIQPRLDHISSQGESETPRMHPQMDARQPYRTTKTPKMQPRSLGFETMENYPQVGELEDSGASTSKGNKGYSASSGKSESPRKIGGKHDEKVTESEMSDSQIDDQSSYEDFSQQLERRKKEKKTSTPQKKRVKGSK